ncbi:hypothetical protein NDU88_003438 [Pleurodeles waltl]|uniref:Uncharacterized protein n=1 Tax=Pleurodeles waltl TaxID=8319 RepID=A0AAV7QA24_PLEWA|nr:hypothetical protein NDU88_003438 [Pleurodeles waltl]
MGTPTDARSQDFRVPSLKGTTDSGEGEKEFSRRSTPGEEEKKTPRQEKEKTGADDIPAIQGGLAGESRDPETSIFRHDPGGSWLNKRLTKDIDQHGQFGSTGVLNGKWTPQN